MRRYEVAVDIGADASDVWAVMRDVERWHQRLACRPGDAKVDWPRSDISEFEFVEGRAGKAVRLGDSRVERGK